MLDERAEQTGGWHHFPHGVSVAFPLDLCGGVILEGTCSPVILVQRCINGEAVYEVWVGQIDAAVADEICVVLIQRLDARLPGVAAGCDEGPLVRMPEDLRKEPLLRFQAIV